MAQGHRQSRRLLALDVRTLILTDKKFEPETYLNTGHIAIYRPQALPDTPQMREALAQAKRERERQIRGG